MIVASMKILKKKMVQIFSQNSTEASTTSSIVVNASWKPVSTEEREFDFNGAERVCVDLPTSKDDKTWPIDIYKLFITDDLLDISSTTNEYAQQKHAA